ncbi:MAG: ASKHA domain-containing protein [Planctomycetota bacterium]
MKHCIVVFEPEGKRVSIHRGATLLEAAGQGGIILNTSCGGAGTCGKCKVQISPRGDEVLACQYIVEEDITVVISADSRFFYQKILEHGVDREIELCPCMCKKHVIVPCGKRPVDVLRDTCGGAVINLSAGVKSKYEQLASQAGEEGVTTVLRGCRSEDVSYEMIDAEAGDTRGRIFGAAVDIGTTTVVARLVDMTTGEAAATAAGSNPQSKYGDDVVSRISYGQSEKGLAELRGLIVGCINELVEELCEKGKCRCDEIYEVAAAGNTTMNHIFLGLPIKQLGQAPYSAYSVAAYDRGVEESGLRINAGGNVHTIENIAGFVGSDTTAAAVAVGMDMAEAMTLVIDIGTNGEVILGTKDKLLAASCAAGPALEGARIHHGSRAVDGAIERVVLNGGDIDVDVIGGGDARSICGSGLIDAAAVLLEVGVIDSTGRFVDPAGLKGKVGEKILRRLIRFEGGRAFVLAGEGAGKRGSVFLTQKDIRELQLAKGAIRAGIKLLQERMGVKDEDISQVLLAGAFGNYIQRKSALRIGLLPQIPVERIKFVGNAASSGAQMVLVSSQCRALAGELSKKIEYVEIGHMPEFQMAFAESMLF